MKKRIHYSNRSYLLPMEVMFLTVEVNGRTFTSETREFQKVMENWGNIFYPQEGVEFKVSFGDTISCPGGWGQDWEDCGEVLKQGDKLKLVEVGNPSTPSMWEVIKK